jgi:hypothetical protein
MSQLLTNKLSAVRRKRAIVTALTGISAALGASIFLLGLTMVLDWWLELPRTARAGMLAVELALIAYFGIWHVILPILRGPDDEELALAVESETPTFRSRLISAIQLSRLELANTGVSTAMVGALVRETEELAEPIDFAQFIKIDRLTTFATTAVVIVIGFGAACAATAPESLALLQRSMLMNVPVPRKTQVECLSRNICVPRGEPVTLSAKASGIVIPDDGWVELEYASGATQTFTMDKVAETRDQFQRVIDNVQEDFTYVIWLNDGHSDEYKVTAAIRPAVASVEVQQKYPDYTGAGTVKRPTGDLAILEGSRLMINITANKRVKITGGQEKVTNFIHLHGVDRDFPLAVNVSDATRLTTRDEGIQIPRGTTGFSINLVDENGITTKNPAVYPVQLVPDQAPRITITAPKRNDELVTAVATVDVGFDASDDYGVSQVLLRYRSVDPDGNIPGSSGDGLAATYYASAKWEKEVAKRVDPEIAFDWNASAGRRDNVLKGSNMAARWVGQLQPPVSGDVTFTVETSSATVRMWLDDEPIITAAGKNESSRPIKLNAHQRYDVRLEYLSPSNIGPLRLYWQTPSVPKQIVPKSALYSVPLADKTALIASGGLPEKIIRLEVPTNKAVRGYYPWKISEFAGSLPVGSVIQWRIEARDNNNVSGPGISFSDTRQLRLVSEADKRKELMDRMGETLTQTDQLLESQRDLRDKTAQIVTGKPVDRPLDLPPEPKK